MTLELKILIASSIFCLIIVTVLLLQKKNYFTHKVFTILMFCSSFIFLMASSFYFYSEYSAYVKRKKQYTEISEISANPDDVKFNHSEIDVLQELSRAKNTLVGYENYLKESARNFNADNFSYENLLKEKLISQFEGKEYSLEYWEDVENTIDKFYEKSTLDNWGEFPVEIIPNDRYEEIEFQNGEESDFIDLFSKMTYVQRKIRNFNRSSESIERFWIKNKVFVYTVISKARYNKISKNIDDLIAVYDRVVQEPNYKEFYANQNLYTDEGDYNEIFLSYPTQKIVKSFHNNWLFGFWDRRFEENNDETVYNILKEIQAHYKD